MLLNAAAADDSPRLTTHHHQLMNTRHTFAATLALAASLPAFADIKVNDHLTISGYAVGSYEYIKPDPGTATDSVFNGAKDTPSADALKTIFTMEFKPVT